MSRLRQYLPIAVAMTSIVLLMPVAAVWLMSSSGITTSLPLLVVSTILASVVVGVACRAGWSRHRESKDVLFADLMLWRWVQRWWAERKLSSVMARLGIDEETMGHEEAVNLNFDALKGLAAALEARDPYTHGHSRRVARYAAMIAKNLGLDQREVAKIRTAAAVHDVGKLEVPLDVLNKPGRLTDEEFELIKVHAPRGAELVAKLGDEELTEIVAHHHERLDGSGYPGRIGGEQIPLGARVVAVADTFDALTSTRAYRPARSHAEALAILHAEAGTQLDPDAVRAFDRYYDGGLASWIAWPMLISLPHRLWASTGAQAQAQAQAVGSSIATGGAAAAATVAIVVPGVASSNVADSKGAGVGGELVAESGPIGTGGEATTASELKNWVSNRDARDSSSSADTTASELKDFVEARDVRLAREGVRPSGGGSSRNVGSDGGADGGSSGDSDGGSRSLEEGGSSPAQDPRGNAEGGDGGGSGDGSGGAGSTPSPGQGPSGNGGNGGGGGSDKPDKGGKPESPGKSGEAPGKPDNPGNPDKGHGAPADPGNGRGKGNPSPGPAAPKPPKAKPPAGDAPGKPANPGNPGKGHGKPESPGNGRGNGKG